MGKKAFTLVELLTVIAIIGALAALAIPAIMSSQARANDKTLESDLINMRAQAVLLYGQTSSYATACTPVSAQVSPGTQYANAAALNSGGANDCEASATAWGAQVQLQSKPNTWYCVDSTGFSQETANNSISPGVYACH